MGSFTGASRPGGCTAALLLSLALAGCALLGSPNPPSRLLDQARASVAQRDLDAAYDRLAELRTHYPDSAETREAFPLAASIFQRGYLRTRHVDPASRWVTTEPACLLGWLLSYCDAPEFPQAEAEALFVGMPYGYFGEFLAAAEAHAALSQWAVRAEDDNGIVEAIVVELSAAAAR
jgi:hypothetical protein